MPDLSLLDATSKASLTPEQLQAFSDHPGPEESAFEGPPTPATPSKPNEVFIDNDSFSKLNAEQFKAFADNFPKGTSIRVGPKPKPVASMNRPPDLDPDSLKQLGPEQLLEFSKHTKWSPLTWAQSHPEHLDPDTLTKLAQTDTLLRKEGLTWADIPFEEVVTALPHLAKGAFDYGSLAYKTAVLPQGSPAQIKAKSEMEAASETASFGTADLARRTYNKMGRFLHLQKPLEDYTPEDSVDLFQRELAVRNQMAKIVSGRGEATKFLGGEDLRQLQETGLKLDEAAIQSASAGDPISFMAFGGGFKLFNAVTGKVVGFAASRSAALQAVQKLGIIRDSVASAEQLAKDIPSAENISAANRAAIMQGAERAGAGTVVRGLEQAQIAGEKALNFAQEAPGAVIGRTIQGAGKLLGGTSEGIRKFAPYEVVGSLAHGNIPAAALGVAASLGKDLIKKAGASLESFGKTVAEGAAPGGTWARAVEDISKVPGQAIGGAAKGFPLDLGLMSLSSETPEEQRQSPFMATAFGAAHGLLLSGRGFVQGQTIAPRPWAQSDAWSKSYGNFPELDREHQETMKIASPGVKERLGALRDLAATTGTEIYQFSGAESLAKFLESQGYSPEDAANAAQSNGQIIGGLKDKNGDARQVILLRDPQSAPHEVGHSLESAMSQQQQTEYYNALLKSHGEEAVMERAKKDALALATTQETADEATVTPDSWKNFLLRITGDGPAAAKGKIAEDPSLAGKPWDSVLTEDEKDQLVKRYALKEISADTISKVLQHTGAGTEKDSGILGVAAKTITRLMVLLGQDPYAGVTEGTMETPIKRGALEAATEAIQPALVEARAGKPTSTKPSIPFTGRAPSGPVVIGTPTEEANKTKEIALAAPEIPTGPETDAQSPREILGVMAEAKASGQGVKLTRRAAPGMSAGAITIQRHHRRIEVERARSIPDDQKPLWEKNFTPIKTVRLKDGRLQEQGWSPEVLASNAEKTSRFLSEVGRTDLSPFEIDPGKGTFTEKGWRDLYDTLQIFAANQEAGLTGKGTPIKIGEAEKFGFYEPVGTKQAAGTVTPEQADFLNYLFGFPLPGGGKPTVTRGGAKQFGAQLISQATEPGRAQPLVEPRTFESAQAKTLDFSGKEVLEVNPLRAQIEQAAKAAGRPAPSPIEVWQNLNMKDIVKAEIVPELPAVRPVGTTLRAGFEPMSGNQRAIKAAAVKDEFGNVFENAMHYGAYEKYLQAVKSGRIPVSQIPGGPVEGFTTSEGEFLNRTQSKNRAEEIGQLERGLPAKGLEAMQFKAHRAFQPMPANPRAVRSAAVRDEQGKIFEGSWHGEAFMKAQEAPGERGNLEEGFVSNDNRWYSREKAAEVAEEIGQMPVQQDRELESGNFERSRAFSPQVTEEERKQPIPLEAGQHMVTVTGPNGEKYPARFDGWQPNIPGKPPLAQITPQDRFPFQGDSWRSTTYDKSLEEKGYTVEGLPEVPKETAFSPGKKEEKHRVGLEFKKFFSDVTKGTFGKSDIPFEPIQDLSNAKDVIAAKAKHSGNFDDHIAKSIPTFYETQIKKAKAITDVYGEQGARVLDIAASEGSFGKTISDLTGGKVKTVSLDPNPDMANFFETKSKVPGATYSQEAFLNGFEDNGKQYPAHNPSEPYDVITEAMGFQFIDPDRAPQIAEVKRLLAPDGVFLTEQKLKNPDWASNEAKKDRDYKAKYFSNEELKQKDTRVGFAQAKDESKAVGMVNNMAEQGDLEKILTDNFKHVVQYWDSGNFKGYAAGDDAAKVNAVVDAMGDTKSEFSTTELPREVTPVPSPEEALSPTLMGGRFAPKKKEADPLKFRAGSPSNPFEGSKAWILPNGTVEQLGSQWHHAWLDENKDVQKKYGLKIPPFEGGDAEGVREQALKKGFARVNLAGATMTVEARQKDWKHIRPIVEDMIERNLDDVDKFRVHLLDDSANKVTNTYADKLFDANTDKEKMSRVYDSFSERPQSELERSSAFAPGKGIIGKVDEEGEVTAKKGNLGLMSHNAFPGAGEAWRYVQDTGEVFWWFNKPDQKTQDIVTSWLESKGNKVVGHKVLGEGTPETDFSRSHGRFQPKKEDFEDPAKLKEALASPGWAIVTGTQESVGPWNDPKNIEANKKLEEDLKEKGYDYFPVTGTYKGEPQGQNFMVLDISPYEAQTLGKKYGQESVLTPKGLLYGDGTITPSDPEKTVVGKAATAEDFYSTLPSGQHFSIPLDFEHPYQPVGEQSQLFGGREVLSSRSTAEMSNADLKEYFPEAVVPNQVRSKKGQLIDPKLESDIIKSPLYKEAGSEEAAVKAFSDKLVDFAKSIQDNPTYQLGLKWYSDFVPLLKKYFGADRQIMAELLAASSPNETPTQNFFYAVDALEGFKAGRFDKIVSKFNEGWDLMKADKWMSWYNRELNAGKIPNPPATPTPEAFMAHWIFKHDLKPKQSNGQLFGFHGKAILEVLARKWLTENQGPKVANFMQNLLGTGHEGTIDVWADRTMRRLGYADYQDRWRLMPKNQAGVTDADFAFAQKAFRSAAEELGILPDALQGGLWFGEKQLWSDNGWARLDLGSYIKEMEQLPFIRANIRQRLTTTQKKAKTKPSEAMEFNLEPRPLK